MGGNTGNEEAGNGKGAEESARGGTDAVKAPSVFRN